MAETDHTTVGTPERLPREERLQRRRMRPLPVAVPKLPKRRGEVTRHPDTESK